MNKNLENELYKDFPELFQEHTLDMSETCMCWGIECGDGWESLIRSMCKALATKKHITVLKKEKYPFQYKLEVWLHNKCRKIERLLGLPYNKLYQAKFDRYKTIPSLGVKFTQIKEKFGTLRVYYDTYHRHTAEDVQDVSEKELSKKLEENIGYIDGVISFAAWLSASICENDGKAGKLYTTGWWRTVCNDCREPKQKNENTNNS